MSVDRPREVSARHLAGLAGIYARQSSERQVEQNQGSMEYQRGQQRWPLAWGWQPECNQLYVDAGLSGTASAHRPEFLKMIDDIKMKRLRAVFAADQSRLARNTIELLTFLTLCRTHDVLLVVDGRIRNLTDDGDAFSSGIVAFVDEFENRKRQAAFERGRLGKIAAGRAVTCPPTGYVHRKDGSWDLDSDIEVQLGIAEVFRVFREQRSAARTVRKLFVDGRRIPRRKPGREVRWVQPSVRAILGIVGNPVYAGQYVYRQRTVDESRGRDGRGHTRVRVTKPDERIEIPSHHAPYISREQADEIRAILKANAPSSNRRNLGPGGAILQGAIGCIKHAGRAMGVDYRGNRPSGREGAYYYHCHGDYDVGGAQCWVMPGRQLDAAVARAVFQRLAPLGLDAVRAEWAAAKQDSLRQQSGKAQAIAQGRRRVDDLKARYAAINPALRNLAEDLERDLNDALGEYERVRGSASGCSQSDLFTEDGFEELFSLCADLPTLFYAPTTAHRDRKEMVRMLVERVIVAAASPESISFTIKWADGSPPTEGIAHLARYAHALIKRFAAEGVPNHEIANRLNGLGLKTTRGRHWTTSTVWQVQDYKLRQPRALVRRKGVCCIENSEQNTSKRYNIGITR